MSGATATLKRAGPVSAVVSGIGQWSKSSECGVGPCRVIIDPPGFDDTPSVTETVEEMLIQALVAQPAIEALDEGILCRLSRRDVVPLNAGFTDPFQDRMAGQLCAIAHWEGWLWLGHGRLRRFTHAGRRP